jgi:hypothetical protein
VAVFVLYALIDVALHGLNSPPPFLPRLHDAFGDVVSETFAIFHVNALYAYQLAAIGCTSVVKDHKP